jgi:hypothetical protein
MKNFKVWEEVDPQGYGLRLSAARRCNFQHYRLPGSPQDRDPDVRTADDHEDDPPVHGSGKSINAAMDFAESEIEGSCGVDFTMQARNIVIAPVVRSVY